ncbi:MAG: NAD(P)H-dependent oxidoreductase [Lachnospiraceae bacterium]|nr:NAD(P)H-dependent oxidoreductase [Lachnospiraceae bacterium]
MNILVINGSPSGDDSVTLQTVLFIKEYFGRHEYTFINAGQKIKAIEKDFSETLEMLKKADLILFCYPVYTFLVPSQLHRFIELIKEHDIDLTGKYATQITTSKHFYDVTAHEFIRENCKDLGLKYINGLSADMEDLLDKKGRRDALSFFRHVLWCTKNDTYDREPLLKADFKPVSVIVPEGEAGNKSTEKRIVIVTDMTDEKSALGMMIDRFKRSVPYQCETVDLSGFPFAGGCLGCFNCASEGKCVYKDGFDDLLRNNIQTADATIYAFSIKDHSMGYTFKLYDDRQFCNGHRTVTMGKPVGYIVDGAVSLENNLKLVIKARAQVGNNYLTGIASNEHDTDRALDDLAKETAYALRHDYSQPADFYGVGGLKIFRDLIYRMQGMMREDHRFYKKHGFYDFPQKHPGTIIGMYAVGAIMSNPKLRKKMGGSMTKGMIMPYKKVIEKAKKNRKTGRETCRNSQKEEI